jgi:translation initiation factor 2 subunit 1
MLKADDYPEEGELIIGTVQTVKNYGAFVILDEYENKEGFIHITEVATGWIKYIRDFIRERQKVVCKVLRVDKSKGHVDLSLKQVNEHQRREKIQDWKNVQKAKKLLEITAEKLGKTADLCYEEFAYALMEKYGSLIQIQNALLEAERSEKSELVVQYVGAPKYRIKVNAPDYKTAEEELKKAGERAINYIKTHNGDGRFIREIKE